MSTEQCFYHLKVNSKQDVPGTHILQIACPECGYHRVVVVCNACTVSIRFLTRPEEGSIGHCQECSAAIPMTKKWNLLGKV